MTRFSHSCLRACSTVAWPPQGSTGWSVTARSGATFSRRSTSPKSRWKSCGSLGEGISGISGSPEIIAEVVRKAAQRFSALGNFKMTIAIQSWGNPDSCEVDGKHFYVFLPFCNKLYCCSSSSDTLTVEPLLSNSHVASVKQIVIIIIGGCCHRQIRICTCTITCKYNYTQIHRANTQIQRRSLWHIDNIFDFCSKTNNNLYKTSFNADRSGWKCVDDGDDDLLYRRNGDCLRVPASGQPVARGRATIQMAPSKKTKMAKNLFFWDYHQKNPVSGRAMVSDKMLHFVAFFTLTN